MARSKTSKSWLKEHFDDPYVKRSQEEGYRSRASFKLLELQEKDGFIEVGMTVVDLGAAPGGWSQVAVELVGDKGKVIASDILPMENLAGVEFVQGDFTDEAVMNELLDRLDDIPADLVISDMAPNMSGMKEIDQPQAMYLAELALEMAKLVVKPGGGLLIKVFHGEGFEALQKELKLSFNKVKVRKPKASRARSSEIYLLSTDFKGKN
jgi:23S rRNA (uridine2552-2'-O)-methyltransferase